MGFTTWRELSSAGENNEEGVALKSGGLKHVWAGNISFDGGVSVDLEESAGNS